MDELQCTTAGVMRLMACDNVIPPRPYTSINNHVVAIYISLEKWFPLQGERAYVLLLHSHSSYPV